MKIGMSNAKLILSKESIKNSELWENAGIELPKFDHDKMSL